MNANAPANLLIMDKIQAYADVCSVVGGKLDDGSAAETAKRIKLEIDCLVSREVEDKSVLLATVIQDHTIIRNATNLMMSDQRSSLETLNWRDGIVDGMETVSLQRDLLIEHIKGTVSVIA